MATDIDSKMYSVADRFGFGFAEMETMKASRLNYWYRGVELLYKREKGLLDGAE